MSLTLENLGKSVEQVAAKVDSMKDKEVGTLTTEMAVQKEKVNRLETIVYSAVGVILIETISIIVMWMQKK